jgi:uncharacterized membrane protein YcaP (DUF421 family)
MNDLEAHLGISAIGALSVMVSAAVLYAALALVLKFWGRRLAVSASTVSVALVTLIGAIAARATLGDSPTLMGGLVAIGTLLVLEQVFGQWAGALALRRTMRWSRSPVVLMVGDRVDEHALRQYGITDAHLWSQLRQRGVFRRGEVGVVILEPRGHMTVIRSGTRLDRDLLVGVKGLEAVPAEMFSPPSGGGRA